MEINIIFGINNNSSSANKKEDSNIDTQWDFPEKIFSQLLGLKENKEGKKTSDSRNNEEKKKNERK